MVDYTAITDATMATIPVIVAAGVTRRVARSVSGGGTGARRRRKPVARKPVVSKVNQRKAIKRKRVIKPRSRVTRRRRTRR